MVCGMSTIVILAFGLLAAVFVGEAIYALFFRNFGLVTFRVMLEMRRVDADSVWGAYFDESNAWNSVSERLSYEVVSENPRVVRLGARLRGTDVAPVMSEFRLDVTRPKRAARATLISVDGAPVSDAERTFEVFALFETDDGVRLEVEAGIPVRGWLRVPLHRRNLRRIYHDLYIACLKKAGVAFAVVERPDLGAMAWRLFGVVASPFYAIRAK